jgi:hypothetical protein
MAIRSRKSKEDRQEKKNNITNNGQENST